MRVRYLWPSDGSCRDVLRSAFSSSRGSTDVVVAAVSAVVLPSTALLILLRETEHKVGGRGEVEALARKMSE